MVSDRFSGDLVRRLEQLAELREKGILSEDEFNEAKRSALAGSSRYSVADKQPGASKKNQRFLEILLIGLGVLTVALGLVIFNRYSKDENVTSPTENVHDDLVAENVTASEDIRDLCGSESTYSGIKDLVFDEAVKAFGGQPGPLNSLRRAVSLKMEVPAVQKIDEEVMRVDCSGRAVIDLPPGVREQFDGARILEAEIEYSLQPAADSSGNVLRIEGAGGMIASLVGAANLLQASQVASQGGPQLVKTYNPSFDCGRRLSNVERMICQSESLSNYDRALSDRYFALKRDLSSVQWQMTLNSQRAFLSERSQCADEACVRQSYVSQARRLDELQSEDMSQI